MIIVRLMGGHSNQLFQYATGRRLADQHNTSLKLDIDTYLANQPNQDTPREYELEVYPLRAEVASLADLKRVLPLGFQPGLAFRAVWRSGFNKKIRPFSEGGSGFNSIVLNLPDNTYLNGYWQNEKYFKDIRNQLLVELEPKTPMSSSNQKFLKAIQATEAVSLHIRREDYVNNPAANKFHGLASMDYYQSSVSLIKKKLGNKPFKIFVFSKEIDWCKDNLKFNHPLVFVEGNKDGADDMRLMKHCKHNIMANSSFSWWGAWLNQNPGKIVIAPKIWFQDKKANSQIDNIPRDWIRL